MNALPLGPVAVVFTAAWVFSLAACGDAAPSLEEVEASGAITAYDQSLHPDAGGSCQLASTGNAACDRCVAQQCCSTYSACKANSACMSGDSCLAQCDAAARQAVQQGDPKAQTEYTACYAACSAQNPTGTQAAYDARQCEPTKCKSVCPST